jgi:phospholipase C
MRRSIRSVVAVAAASGISLAGAAAAVAAPGGHHSTAGSPTTPIKHLVVIFDENVSFDHYFGTYPKARNNDGNPFHAAPGTPSVNGLSSALRTSNPNKFNPRRLAPAQALTCDQDHAYTAEQAAYDNGLMDKFVEETGSGTCSPPNVSLPSLVMDYYDGNTVTGLWNYAQRYSMSDNFYDTEFGPSTPGAINLISGQTWGGTGMDQGGTPVTTDPGVVGSPDTNGTGTVYSDQDPFYDECSRPGTTLSMSGPNIGTMLSAQHVTWGWFEGGFAPTSKGPDGTPVCGATHDNIGGVTIPDYIPHHEPFQYYSATANPFHLPPASLAEVGRGGQANHQYDLSWFFKDLSAGSMPAVSFLKAGAYQDGHAGYSDPIDEQHFLVRTINAIQRSPLWKNTAIMVTYDDSDGWYDHVMSPIINSSADPATDVLNGAGACGHGTPMGGAQDRCGYGQRLPFLLISPFAKSNYVSGSLTDQTSVLSFIEDNWLASQRIGNGSFDSIAGSVGDMFDFSHPNFTPLILSQTTGEPVSH